MLYNTPKAVLDAAKSILEKNERVHTVQSALDEKLIGKQHRIDKNKNNKIDAHDFKLLRKEEAKKVDQDKDGDNDFADVMMARRKAGGQSHSQAHAATRKHNEEVKKPEGKNVKEQGFMDKMRSAFSGANPLSSTATYGSTSLSGSSSSSGLKKYNPSSGKYEQKENKTPVIEQETTVMGKIKSAFSSMSPVSNNVSYGDTAYSKEKDFRPMAGSVKNVPDRSTPGTKTYNPKTGKYESVSKEGSMVEDTEQQDEATLSAKAARAGKDIGKPGKTFSKIASDAAKRYGSEAAGKRVAGAVLKKMRANEATDTPGNSTHQCAIHVKHEQFGEGKTLTTQHATPAQDGSIEWYDVMFEHGIEKKVPTVELEITLSETHMHKGKK